MVFMSWCVGLAVHCCSLVKVKEISGLVFMASQFSRPVCLWNSTASIKTSGPASALGEDGLVVQARPNEKKGNRIVRV